MVVDLHRVNELLKPIITLLPKIDEILQQITALKPTYMSTFDICKGYIMYYCLRKAKNYHLSLIPKLALVIVMLSFWIEWIDRSIFVHDVSSI